jgi:hypothetical protein
MSYCDDCFKGDSILFKLRSSRIDHPYWRCHPRGNSWRSLLELGLRCNTAWSAAIGKTEKIGGVQCYIATPNVDYPKDKVVLFLTDVFGLALKNNCVSCGLWNTVPFTQAWTSSWPMILRAMDSRCAIWQRLRAESNKTYQWIYVSDNRPRYV